MHCRPDIKSHYRPIDGCPLRRRATGSIDDNVPEHGRWRRVHKEEHPVACRHVHSPRGVVQLVHCGRAATTFLRCSVERCGQSRVQWHSDERKSVNRGGECWMSSMERPVANMRGCYCVLRLVCRLERPVSGLFCCFVVLFLGSLLFSLRMLESFLFCGVCLLTVLCLSASLAIEQSSPQTVWRLFLTTQSNARRDTHLKASLRDYRTVAAKCRLGRPGRCSEVESE